MGRQLGVKKPSQKIGCPRPQDLGISLGIRPLTTHGLWPKSRQRRSGPDLGWSSRPALPPAQPNLPFVCQWQWRRQLRCNSPRWLIQASCWLCPASPGSMSPLSPPLACLHADCIPRGHSGLDLLQGGQIKPMVFLGSVCDAACAQLALCPAPLTSEHFQRKRQSSPAGTHLPVPLPPFLT